ncbi:short-chain dehydrogenase [Devosia riboflavina]|uniref:Short-chain dehydrogenase n=1 Tax=Devosia riboflavina TaxID=46914 RepID=A0A087M776_9HYPH|nr:glucose 1-dehydrogenase [Devosia riboflavina]KFL32729.1 short-chain dehydrogenase [Devosia riboflavina]
MDRRTVCITGSTHGIGLGIAKAFAADGHRLILNSHIRDHHAEAAIGELSALTDVRFVQTDLSKAGGAERLIEEAHAQWGALDTLVNNAGTFLDAPFGQLTEDIFDRTFALNVRAYLFASQAFANRVTQGQTGASIICVGSTNSMAAERDSVAYDTSKGAVLMLVKSLAVTLASRGIRVNGLGPGLVRTPLTAAALASEDLRKSLARQIPLGRIAEPEDIGGAAVFLASDEARYITGQMLFIDGGILANQLSWGVEP